MKRLYIHKWIISYHSFYYGFYETLYNDYEIFYQLRCLFIVKMQCTLSCKHVRSDINKQRIYNKVAEAYAACVYSSYCE